MLLRRAAARMAGSHFVAGAFALLVLGVTLAVSASGTAGAPSPLSPDLKTRPLTAVNLCQEARTTLTRSDACHGTGRTVVRLTNRVADAGRGPIELAAVPAGQDLPEDCHGNGDVDVNGDGTPDDDDTWVEQRTYNDANGDGIFQRSTDTGYSTTIVGCRYYHPEHHHYHFAGYARFRLYSLTGQLMRSGDKISFCIADSNYFNSSLPGAPQSMYYDPAACRSRTSTSGTSVGWYDQYGWKLPGQEIDVSGIPAGNYCLVAQADPANKLAESSDANNDVRQPISVDPSRAPIDSYVSVKKLAGAC